MTTLQLTKLTRVELLEMLAKEAQCAYEDGVYGDVEKELDNIDKILYVLRNCNYKDCEEE